MTYIPDNTQKGAFGEQITAHKSPIVQIANKYQIDPSNLTDTIEIFEATGGSADNSGNLFRCQTGTTQYGYGVVRSKETLNYHAGQGIEATFTADFTTGIASSLQFGGMFNLTETVAVGYDGITFGFIHSYNGAAEVQLITVTATGNGLCTVILDGDGVGISVTNSDVQTNAEELRAGLQADGTLSGKWRFEQIDDKVYCISKSVGDKTGTMSISGGVTASIAEQTTGVTKTDNHSAFNITTTPFDGFVPTKLNIYRIQLGYLGVANINVFVYNPNTGSFVHVHREKWANSNDGTHVGEPNFKIGWTAASLGSSGTNLTVTGASAAIMVEGDEIRKNDVHAEDFIDTSVTATLSNVITIKNRVVFGDKFNLGKILPIRVSIDNEHNKGTIIELYKNATLGGATNYQFHDEYNSVATYDTAGTTLTGGSLIDAFTVPANGDVIVDLETLKFNLLPEDTFTIAAKTVSGSAANVTSTITWSEDK